MFKLKKIELSSINCLSVYLPWYTWIHIQIALETKTDVTTSMNLPHQYNGVNSITYNPLNVAVSVNDAL